MTARHLGHLTAVPSAALTFKAVLHDGHFILVSDMAAFPGQFAGFGPIILWTTTMRRQRGFLGTAIAGGQ
jgi:hypothetical protein